VGSAAVLTLKSLIVTDGLAEEGGGIRNSGTLTVENSTLSGNSAGDDGGGIFNNGTLTVKNSTLWDNEVGRNGSGIYNSAGTVEITNSTLSGNLAGDAGGGIYNRAGTVEITNSTLSNNAAQNGTNGGGISNFGTVTITDSTLSGNSAQSGGGLRNSGTATITNSTLSGNSAGNAGGGGISNDGTVTITNSIVANSQGDGNCRNFDTFTALGSNVDTDGTCPGFAQVTSADLDLGPLFFNGGPTQTHALLADSVAIDNGDQAECTADNITTDQRGFLRDDGQCDIGAFEFGAGPRADLLISLGVDKTSVKQGQLLTYTVTVLNFGADTAQNVIVNDTLSTGTTFVSAAANKGNITTKPPVGQTGTVTWALGDLLDDEQGAATIVVKVLVKGKTTVTNTATVSSATVDRNPANNTAAITVSVAPGTSKR
jgi:uncharacterized repeat protein (TIGR01451 family)